MKKKIFFIMMFFLVIIRFVSADCTCEYPNGLTYNGCLSNEYPYCHTEYGSISGYCTCLENCVCGDGYTANYEFFDDGGTISCSEECDAGANNGACPNACNDACSLNTCPQCIDGIDNDGDGFIDYPSDTGCSTEYDSSEEGSTSNRCINLVDLYSFIPGEPNTWLNIASVGTCTSVPNGIFTCSLSSDGCVDGYSPSLNYDPTVGCLCACVRDPCCGDGNINTNLGETCDNGMLIPTGLSPPNPVFVPGNIYLNMTLNDDSLDCMYDCQINPLSLCGNGVLDGTEECDDGLANSNTGRCNLQCKDTICGDGMVQWPNGVGVLGTQINNNYGYEECDGASMRMSCESKGYYVGTPSCTNTCVADYSTCSNQCGDGYCGTGENQENCLADCSEDLEWTFSGDGWTLDEGSLRGERWNIYAYSNYFSLKTGKTYEVSADIHNPNIDAGCVAVVTLNQGRCLNASTWEFNELCFDQSPISNVVRASGTTNWETKTGTITLPLNNPNADSDGYINKARLQIAIWCSNPPATPPQPIYFDNVMFREVIPSDVHYDVVPSFIDSTNACCPKDFCWDGSMCVDSDIWQLNSSTEPLWNNIFTPEDRWISNHVNRHHQDNAQGYRCVLDENQFANWEPAEIKYDWNYNESGYCNNKNNCFVSKTFSGLNPVDLTPAFGTGDSCIKNGTFISDAYVVDEGNNYCFEGEWTTRTYFAATYLTAWAQQASAQDEYYILSCGRNNELFNMPDESSGGFNALLTDSCNIIIKDGSDEKVMLALIPQRPMAPTSEGNLGDVFQKIIEQYDGMGYQTGTIGLTIDIPGGCADIPSSPEWVDCLIYASGDRNLDIYYNKAYKFFIVADDRITEIDPTWLQQIWSRISGFFVRLFGLVPQSPQYRLFNATSSYDKIYILKEGEIYVKGIEEEKYDEIVRKFQTYTYINHTPSTMDYNIDIHFINGTYKPQFIKLENLGNTKEFIMISNNSVEVWPYLTYMLRSRE